MVVEVAEWILRYGRSTEERKDKLREHKGVDSSEEPNALSLMPYLGFVFPAA